MECSIADLYSKISVFGEGATVRLNVLNKTRNGTLSLMHFDLLVSNEGSFFYSYYVNGNGNQTHAGTASYHYHMFI